MLWTSRMRTTGKFGLAIPAEIQIHAASRSWPKYIEFYVYITIQTFVSVRFYLLHPSTSTSQVVLVGQLGSIQASDSLERIAMVTIAIQFDCHFAKCTVYWLHLTLCHPKRPEGTARSIQPKSAPRTQGDERRVPYSR